MFILVLLSIVGCQPTNTSSFEDFLKYYATNVPKACANEAWVHCLGITTATCVTQETTVLDSCIERHRGELATWYEKLASHRNTTRDDSQVGLKMGACVGDQFRRMGGYADSHWDNCKLAFK
jgi:hypothetical protein